ncbi:alpha/beta hydrolase [Peptacetobacter sp.]|uniref:alpha/beta hydrolase n=1 Tax=Peptacetobacter sp. TaxID=2991975 RepID=UPI0026357F7A|nr:alpha/beta hydrolase [Peptacetobacter sp.]
MHSDKSSKIRKKKKNEKQYDTFSLTMELNRPLITEEELKKQNEEKQYQKKRKLNKNIFKVLACILIIVVIGTFAWLSNSYEPQDIARENLISNNEVFVEEGDVTKFIPKEVISDTGIIIYPGARVDVKAYSPLANRLAQKGYKVFAADMPFNMAIFSSHKADKIIEDNKDIKDWIIVGHSLGGSMATKAVETNNKIKGIVYLASYPSNDKIKLTDAKVLSIWGSKDGVINFENLIKSKDFLPKDTKYVEIEGGNHSDFADYGLQKGDNKAITSEKEQLNITVESISDFIKDKIN